MNENPSEYRICSSEGSTRLDVVVVQTGELEFTVRKV